MFGSIEGQFDPSKHKKDILKIWDNCKIGEPSEENTEGVFSIVLPPPNVTGSLHIGHALGVSIQDAFSRYYRIKGKKVVWSPGTDHAGIATQSVVERRLISEGIDPKLMKREDLIKEIDSWRIQRESNIINQIKEIGASCAWSKYKFTLDKDYSNSVNEAFKIMFNKGLIYKGSYIINWDTQEQTALSDDEIEYEENKGTIWNIKYFVPGLNDNVLIATTRPETILGDVAIAFHPDDERYQRCKGLFAINPITGTTLKFVASNKIDKDFGTGLVKITPAHDKLDYDIGLDNKLDIVQVIGKDGKIVDGYGKYSGNTIYQAREAIVKDLDNKGLIESKKEHFNRLAISYRSKAPIENIISEQWFLSLSKFKDELMDLIEKDNISIFPDMHIAAYKNWINNLRDWCISRQLVWGHRIPIWENRFTKELKYSVDGDGLSEDWIQDTSVLDTWFSSALWPYAIFGWPNNTKDLDEYYPISKMITGHDILFFWVARMLATGMYLTDKIPFKNIVLHGLLFGKSLWKVEGGSIQYIVGEERKKLLNEKKLPSGIKSKWEKVSKSKGNVIDPLDIISENGPDALRIGLLYETYLIPQIDVSESRFKQATFLINKIWNSYKLINQLINKFDAKQGFCVNDFSDINWMNNLLLDAFSKSDDFIEKNDLSKSLKTIEKVFWEDYCSIFLEIAKSKINDNEVDQKIKNTYIKTIVTSFISILQYFHMYAPFATEEIYQRIILRNDIDLSSLGVIKVDSIAKTRFSRLIDKRNDSEFFITLDILDNIRAIRGEMSIDHSVPIDIWIFGNDLDIIKKASRDLYRLTKINSILFEEKNIYSDKVFGTRIIKGNKELCIELPKSMIDVEVKRLNKELEKINLNIKNISARLNNKMFLEKVSENLVNENKINLSNLEERKDIIKATLDKIS